MRYALEPLFDNHSIDYAIVNSSESRATVELCAKRLVPTIFLMHEFGTYVSPVSELRRAFDWADEIVFPARLVARSSESVHRHLVERDLKILPQGMSELPPDTEESIKLSSGDPLSDLRANKAEGTLFVLGAGGVSLRKGVDLFIAVAAAVKRSYPDKNIHFVWIGQGYRPDRDMNYSIYLKEQLERSDLDRNFSFLNEVPDLEDVYSLADIFLLTSRLDPLPNVSIDAAWRGIPIVCFEGASGTADLLQKNSVTAYGVVPHLDVQAAGDVIAELASNEPKFKALSQATSIFAREIFDMEAYVRELDSIGASLAVMATQWRADFDTISRDRSFNQDFFLGAEPILEDRDRSIQRYLASTRRQNRDSAWSRRPAPGFNQDAWEHFHEIGSEEPFASFIRAGRPKGLWQVPVLRGSVLSSGSKVAGVRAMIHVLADDASSLVRLISRLDNNRKEFDLVVSVASDVKKSVSDTLKQMNRSAVILDRGLGRISALAAYLGDHEVSDRYEVLAHLEASSTRRLPGWQEFQWETLVGGYFRMADIVVQSFEDDPALGLVYSADPFIPNWSEEMRTNVKQLGSAVAKKDLGMDYGFDFPEGGMFWIRPEIVQYLAKKGEHDETIREALFCEGSIFERLLPLVCAERGLTQAVTFVEATGW